MLIFNINSFKAALYHCVITIRIAATKVAFEPLSIVCVLRSRFETFIRQGVVYFNGYPRGKYRDIGTRDPPTKNRSSVFEPKGTTSATVKLTLTRELPGIRSRDIVHQQEKNFKGRPSPPTDGLKPKPK